MTITLFKPYHFPLDAATRILYMFYDQRDLFKLSVWLSLPSLKSLLWFIGPLLHSPHFPGHSNLSHTLYFLLIAKPFLKTLFFNCHWEFPSVLWLFTLFPHPPFSVVSYSSLSPMYSLLPWTWTPTSGASILFVFSMFCTYILNDFHQLGSYLFLWKFLWILPRRWWNRRKSDW